MLRKIHSRVKSRPMLFLVLKNIGWLSFDKVLRLVVSLLVGILVARYLGPTDFGLMSFAIALTALLSPFIGLGVGSILTKELLHNQKKSGSILGVAFILYIATAVAMAIVVNACEWLIRPGDFEALAVVFVFSFGFFTNSVNDVLSSYFNSRVESKKPVLAGSAGLIISNVLKVFAMLVGLPLFYIVVASVLEMLIGAICLLYFYEHIGGRFSKWKFDWGLAKKLIHSSWPLVLSGTMVVVYLKIDQVMIGILMNDTQVGVYSIAVKLSEFFFFLPASIAVSLFPSIIASKKSSAALYRSRLQKFFDLMTWIPFSFMIPMCLLANFVVVFLYGAEYALAGPALAISIWSALAVSIRFALERYLIIENETKIIFFSAFLGALSNVLLNLFLIPGFGIIGAAAATVISYTFSTYCGILFFPRTRKVFFMLLKSFNLFRIVREVKGYLK